MVGKRIGIPKKIAAGEGAEKAQEEKGIVGFQQSSLLDQQKCILPTKVCSRYYKVVTVPFMAPLLITCFMQTMSSNIDVVEHTLQFHRHRHYQSFFHLRKTYNELLQNGAPCNYPVKKKNTSRSKVKFSHLNIYICIRFYTIVNHYQ